MTLFFRARALPLITIAMAGASLLQVSCGSSSSSDGGGGSGGGGITSCIPASAECYGSAGPGGPGSGCLALADNTGAGHIQLRVSQLEVAAPAVLSAPFMQDAIITKKTTLTAPKCFQNGDAEFNTLFDFDTAAMTVKAGGGVPQALVGPPTDGTCFASFKDAQSGITIGPIETPFTMTGNEVHAVFDAGSKMPTPQPDLVIPIYLEDKLDQYVLLPLHEVDLKATLSDDHNCVGAFKGDTLSPTKSCVTDQGTFAWTNGGTYTAYITVEESDTVLIDSLGYTLCVLLSGDVKNWKGPDGTCKTSDGFAANGNKLPTGQWCATTNSAGGCADSFHLETKFAASAIKLMGSFDPQTNKCSG